MDMTPAGKLEILAAIPNGRGKQSRGFLLA
jgi:hypothetical protein